MDAQLQKEKFRLNMIFRSYLNIEVLIRMVNQYN